MKIPLNPFSGIHVDLILPEGWDHTVQWPKTIASGEAQLYIFPISGINVQTVFVCLFLDPARMTNLCITKLSLSPNCKIIKADGNELTARKSTLITASITVSVENDLQVLTIV